MLTRQFNTKTSSGQLRDLSGLIIPERTSFVYNFPTVKIIFHTSNPHHLCSESEIILSNNGGNIKCGLTIINENSFYVVGEFSKLLQVRMASMLSNSETLVTLIDELECLNGNDVFTIYSKEASLPNCYVIANNLDGILYNQVVVPMAFSPETRRDLMETFRYILDYRFINKDTLTFYNDFKVYEGTRYIELPLFISQNADYTLNYNSPIINSIDNKVRKTLLPDVVDMEKRVFIPYWESIDGKTERVSEFVFIPHFRMRSNEDWALDDRNTGWNSTGDTPDNITDLGFTVESDVAYQKMRLKKSFLRIFYYDSPDKTNQTLLAYSTIFFDSGEAYTQYTQNPQNTKIGVRFVVHDKYDYTRSSEGFYLYLFPYNLESESSGRTIYMKVEFNHAGVGKTIPLAFRYNDKGYMKLGPEPESGETAEDVVDMEAYYNDLYMPVRIKFNREKNQFEYYFFNNDTNSDYNISQKKSDDNKRNVVTIILTEPRVNKVE